MYLKNSFLCLCKLCLGVFSLFIIFFNVSQKEVNKKINLNKNKTHFFENLKSSGNL